MPFTDKIKGLLTFQEPNQAQPFELLDDPRDDSQPPQPPRDTSTPPEKLQVSPRLEDNTAYLARVFGYPANAALVLREFTLGLEPGFQAVAVYLEGLVDAQRQAREIFEPLMLIARSVSCEAAGLLVTAVQKKLTPANRVQPADDLSAVVDEICAGKTALFFQGAARALLVETAGWEHRSVEQPTVERIIQGPQDSFNEEVRTNTALVRRLLRDPRLITEFFKVGRRSRTEVAIMYLADIANPRLVNEAKRRIQSLDVDAILSTGELNQHLEDDTRGVYPLGFSTERVDSTVQHLLLGKVAVFVEGDPFVTTFPATVWEMMHTQEDFNLRGIVATMLRAIRWLAAIIVVLLPSFYIAVVGFHQEMVPTDVLLSIVASRELVPFPSVMEVLIMETAFELIREGGVRVPGVIGPTLGIVGAIILGQAAVAANLVSPAIIIIVAITGISSFAIPSYTLSTALRIYRFAYILAASTLGLWGVGLALSAHLMALSSLKSFGIPYLTPVGPEAVTTRGVLVRGPIWQLERRADYTQPQDKFGQPRIARRWILDPSHLRKGKKR